MAKKEHSSRLFPAFVAVMLAVIVIGLFMMVYGSLHNGLPVPALPGASPLAQAGRCLHG